MQQKLLRRLALIAAFALLTAAGAQVYWRPGGVPAPVSCGLLAVFLTGAALPKKDALLAQLVYLLLVMAGVPAYSGFLGGMQVVTSMNGGYLIAYPLVAVVVAFAVERRGRGLPVCFCAMAGALPAYFAIAFGQLMAVSGMDAAGAFALAVRPQWLPALGFALAGALIVRLWGLLLWHRRRARRRPH